MDGDHTSWREEILSAFPPGVYRLTLVADPDELVTEEVVAAELRERGFETLSFEDPIAFRYAYESGYRSRWERGEDVALVVVLRGEAHDLDSLPYDLLRNGRKLSFGLASLFPNLSYPVVAALARPDLDVLYAAQAGRLQKRLGENETKDFVLRHVFGIVPDLIQEPSDLLRVLLRRHYTKRGMPEVLDDRLLQLLRRTGRFSDWPLKEMIPDANAFLSFLQERWPIFLDRIARSEGYEVKETTAAYEVKKAGPREIPFDNADVRVHIDNLFLEGLLRPVPYPEANHFSGRWIAAGLEIDPKADEKRRMIGLLKNTEGSIPEPSADRREWLAFARPWAELTALWQGSDLPELEDRFLNLREKLDAAFASWLPNRYGGLHNLSPASPAMLHHVPRFLARKLESGEDTKTALVVVDGLAFDQWVPLRGVLSEQLPGLVFDESAVFAWAPTITPVSRQALFAGNPPAYFPSSIGTTAKEQALWVRFWADSLGLTQAGVVYANVPGNRASVDDAEEAISHPKVRVAGIVVRMVDEIMHGEKLGTHGMHDGVRRWAEEGYPRRLLELLLERGFSVYLTSDHGNIEAVGIGPPSEGSIAGVRGERARVYSANLLRERVAKEYTGSVEWPNTGLPADYLPLLAPGRTAFIPVGERTVTHGGVSFEELVVPFVRVGKERA